VITSIGRHTGINVHKSVGGEPVREDINRLRDTDKPVHVTAGTPGRVIQMLEKNHMDVTALKILVVDEADEMLKIGFRDQLCRIFQFIPETTQVAIFSATMPPEAMDISKKFMRDPVSILVRAEQLTLEGIRQYMIMLHHEENKFETLMDIYARVSVNQTIIFCNSKRKVNFLSENLVANGFTVSSLHADMDTKDRNEIYNQFKKGQARILVTTDVLSRGIDVQGVSIVINYDIPKNKECYIHRIGRSGRYGRKGTAINFVTNEEVRDMKAIERFYETQIDEMPVNFDKYL
jgi:translation initiation factor 4A